MNTKTVIALIVLVVALLGYSFITKLGDEDNSGQDFDSAIVDVSEMDVYTHPEFGYQLPFPRDFTIENNGDYSILLYPQNQPLGAGPVNFIYVSVVTPEMRDSVGEVYNYNPDDFQQLITVENVGESVNLAEGTGQDDWYEYTLVAVEELDGAMVKNFENTRPWEFPAGTTENRFIYDTGENIYILGYYTGGDGDIAHIDPRIAYSIIKNFKAQ